MGPGFSGKCNCSTKTQRQGQDLEVVYTGAVDGDKMSGKVEFVGAGEGTFTGKKT